MGRTKLGAQLHKQKWLPNRISSFPVSQESQFIFSVYPTDPVVPTAYECFFFPVTVRTLQAHVLAVRICSTIAAVVEACEFVTQQGNYGMDVNGASPELTLGPKGWSKLGKCFTRSQVAELLTYLIEQNHFNVGGLVLHQIKGMPVGLPAATQIVNVCFFYVSSILPILLLYILCSCAGCLTSQETDFFVLYRLLFCDCLLNFVFSSI